MLQTRIKAFMFLVKRRRESSPYPTPRSENSRCRQPLTGNFTTKQMWCHSHSPYPSDSYRISRCIDYGYIENHLGNLGQSCKLKIMSVLGFAYFEIVDYAKPRSVAQVRPTRPKFWLKDKLRTIPNYIKILSHWLGKYYTNIFWYVDRKPDP